MGQRERARRLAGAHVEVLARVLPVALTGDPEAIHRSRVASRRLRAAAPVVLEAGDARRTVVGLAREVTRGLGAVRELDVAITSLDTLAGVPGGLAEVLTIVRRSLVAMRTAHARAVRAQGDRFDVAALKTVMRRAVRRHDRGAVRSDRDALAVAERRMRAARDEWQAALVAAGNRYDLPRLHAVRLATKKLRYGLELKVALGGVGGNLLECLEDTQEALGNIHDLAVLAAYVDDVSIAWREEPAVVRGCRRLRRHLTTVCRQRHRQYLADAHARWELAGQVDQPSSRPGTSKRRGGQ